MKTKLLIVTGSSMKFRELSSGLADFFDCEQREWDQPEIQGISEEIIKHKLLAAYAVFRQPILVDDSSIGFEVLNWFPGPYMKDFLKHMNAYDMGVKFSGSLVRSSCFLGLCFNENYIHIVEGKITGKVVTPKHKDSQDRYCDLFIQVDGTDRPMIELSTEEKNKFSHRGRAMQKLLEILNKEGK
jgi:non-canonical purine NTP pyrophosphatase (RdgB/HAM1 family)